MLKKQLKSKLLFFFFKKVNKIKKKFIYILGSYGNYSYNIILKKINKFFLILPIKKIKYLNVFNKKIFPYENNNGGIVHDTIKYLLTKRFFITILLIINVNHKFFFLKNKKKIFFHNQTKKQSYISVKTKFNKIKKKLIFSNSNFNNGINIVNKNTLKILPINIININLKNNVFNKTKFILNSKINIKKKIILILLKNINNFIFYKYLLNFYIKKKNFLLEFFFLSLRNTFFIMKFLKKKNIYILGFYNIL